MRHSLSVSISVRAQAMLKQLVEIYIEQGQPVGSKTLAEQTCHHLSPATIRKVLGDLEDQGFLVSPHTSSGRVPTAKGLRFFVDSLLTVHPLGEENVAEAQAKINPHQTTENLLSCTTQVLSEFTQMMGMVTLPKREKIVLKQIEFIALSENRVLAVLVMNECEVQNRIILANRVYSNEELKQASQFLNQFFAGKDLRVAREEIILAMKQDKSKVDWAMQTVLDVASDVASKVFSPETTYPKSDYFVAGESNLLSSVYHQPSIHERIPDLLSAFQEKQQILSLLDGCLNTDGVQMFIGEESGWSALKEFSIVTSAYTVSGKVVGVLGVIGPTRMPYDRVIPFVDMTAKLLGTALNQQN
jgi:heat-inducible transcriptional repressor